MTLPEGAAVSVYSRIEDIIVPWADVGARVTDREFILAPLNRVSNSYSGLVMALESLQRKVKLPSQCLMHKGGSLQGHSDSRQFSVRILRR